MFSYDDAQKYIMPVVYLCGIYFSLLYDLEPELIWFVAFLSAGYTPLFGVDVDKLCLHGNTGFLHGNCSNRKQAGHV